ncbi:hypothetical protein ACIBQ5_33645 [Streptomyces massasporeus]|uniref:hypothetical protein n=1 Tax=Streptomyces massasporeus TaxID=67324 RepID=UPI0037B5B85A
MTDFEDSAYSNLKNLGAEQHANLLREVDELSRADLRSWEEQSGLLSPGGLPESIRDQLPLFSLDELWEGWKNEAKDHPIMVRADEEIANLVHARMTRRGEEIHAEDFEAECDLLADLRFRATLFGHISRHVGSEREALAWKILEYRDRADPEHSNLSMQRENVESSDVNGATHAILEVAEALSHAEITGFSRRRSAIALLQSTGTGHASASTPATPTVFQDAVPSPPHRLG